MAFITLHPPVRATSHTLGAERTPICAVLAHIVRGSLSTHNV